MAAYQITQSVSDPGTAPERTDPDNFDSRADDFLAVLSLWGKITTGELIVLAAQMNALSTAVNGYSTSAAASLASALVAQTAAEAAQSAALQSANATIWIGGSTYAAGAIVLDPGNSYFSYTSQQAANTGHTPNTDNGTWWELTIADTTNAINNADAKTTPVDADLLALIDSEASNVLKKITWANLKATISGADYIANQVFS